MRPYATIWWKTFLGLSLWLAWTVRLKFGLAPRLIPPVGATIWPYVHTGERPWRQVLVADAVIHSLSLAALFLRALSVAPGLRDAVNAYTGDTVRDAPIWAVACGGWTVLALLSWGAVVSAPRPEPTPA